MVYPLPRPFQFSRDHGGFAATGVALMKNFHQFRESGFDFLLPRFVYPWKYLCDRDAVEGFISQSHMKRWGRKEPLMA